MRNPFGGIARLFVAILNGALQVLEDFHREIGDPDCPVPGCGGVLTARMPISAEGVLIPAAPIGYECTRCDHYEPYVPGKPPGKGQEPEDCLVLVVIV